MSKIDTQGMSGGTVKGCMDNVYPRDEKGNPIYPPFNPPPLPIFGDKERAELIEIMIEALKDYYQGEKTHPAWTLDQFQE